MKLPFGTVTITEESILLVNEALKSGRVSGGKLVRSFEQRFAELAGVSDAVALSSGTDADTLALAVLHDFGACRGDEVIVPALSFVSTGNSVLHAGFTPVFIDIDPKTLNVDPALIEQNITEKTRAVMPVHLMGKPAPMDEIQAIAKKYGLAVIEDAAEAHGALYNGKPAGTIGDMGAFSLYVAHIITTVEGGIVLTDNPEYASILRSLRSHGRACVCDVCLLNTASGYCAKRFERGNDKDMRFLFDRIGYSCKMNELEAAVGLGNLNLYDEILAKRRKNLLFLLEEFKHFSPYLYTIEEEGHERIGPHAFPFIVSQEASFSRENLAAYLEKAGIETRTLFSSMPTQCKGFAFLGHSLGDFPHAEYVGAKGLHIGVHQDLSQDHLTYFLETIETFLLSAV